MREEGNKIKQPRKGIAADTHGSMIARECNAVLGIVHIRRILQIPILTAQRDGDQPVVGTRCSIECAGIPLILSAERTGRISRRLHFLGRRNGQRILLRLGEVDGNIHLAIRRWRFPFAIAGNAVGTDVIGGTAEGIVVVGRRLGRDVHQARKTGNHLARPRGQKPHQLGVKEIPMGHGVSFDQPCFHRIITQPAEDFGKRRDLPGLCRRRVLLEPQGKEQTVDAVCLICRRDQPLTQGIIDQLSNAQIDHGVFSPQSVSFAKLYVVNLYIV